VADLSVPYPTDAAVNPDDGKMIAEFMLWTQDVTALVNFLTPFEGTGSPEGVLEGVIGKFYTDTDIPSQYRKSVNDVAGDKTLGWLIVV